MGVRLPPELEARLTDLARWTGRPPDDLGREAIAGYLDDLDDVRAELDRRYDDYAGGRVTPIDGEAFFERLRARKAAAGRVAYPCGRRGPDVGEPLRVPMSPSRTNRITAPERTTVTSAQS